MTFNDLSELELNQSLTTAEITLRKHQVREATLKYAIISGVIAGFIGLIPIPAISRLILPFVEVRLLRRISSIHEQPLTGISYLTAFVALFFAGGVLGTIIDVILIPFIGVGAIAKGIIAAGIVYGLGEAASQYYSSHPDHESR